MMKKFALTAFAALATLVSYTDASAQKIAVIDSRAVLEAYPEAIAANQRLSSLQKMWQDSLQTMKTQLQTKFETYQSVLDQLTAEKKKSAEAELGLMQENAAKFEQAKFGQQGELAKEQAAIVGPLLEKVRAIVTNFAKKEKFGLVLDKTAAIYFDPASDMTEKVIAHLKAGGK